MVTRVLCVCPFARSCYDWAACTYDRHLRRAKSAYLSLEDGLFRRQEEIGVVGDEAARRLQVLRDIEGLDEGPHLV